jgi:serine/threonine protein kinase
MSDPEAQLLHRGATAGIALVMRHGVEVVEKRLLAHARDNAEARDDLRREGRILASLAGRGAPRVIDVGEDVHGPFVRTQRGPKDTLASIDPASAQAHFATLTRAAFVALATVHEADDLTGPLAVVHGDVSGPNVLVSPARDACSLVDFQLASYREGAPPFDGAFRGTLDTAAPEVASGERPTIRSDIFSLAASLVASALGRSLRPEGLAEAVRLVRAAEEPIAISVADLSFVEARLAQGLLACLSHDAAQRPKSARDALALLAPP